MKTLTLTFIFTLIFTFFFQCLSCFYARILQADMKNFCKIVPFLQFSNIVGDN